MQQQGHHSDLIWKIATEFTERHMEFGIYVDAEGKYWTKAIGANTTEEEDNALVQISENKLRSMLRVEFKKVCSVNDFPFSQKMFEKVYGDLTKNIQRESKEAYKKGDFLNNPSMLYETLDFSRQA